MSFGWLYSGFIFYCLFWFLSVRWGERFRKVYIVGFVISVLGGGKR